MGEEKREEEDLKFKLIKFYKPTKETKVGIVLKRENTTGPIIVENISETSLLNGIQEGDAILSVNNIDCRDKTAVDTCKIIGDSVGVVSIVSTRLRPEEYESYYSTQPTRNETTKSRLLFWT